MFSKQIFPIFLAFVVFLALSGITYAVILLLNALVPGNPISLEVRPADLFIGFTIYLKTSIDFAIFIGRMIEKNNTLEGRISIEIGTAVGNALGTLLVLFIWVLLKEVPALLAVMIFIASLVLLELGESGLEHMESFKGNKYLGLIYNGLENFFLHIGKLYKPFLSKIMPDLGSKMKGARKMGFRELFFFSSSIPFILGLDDFAGYVSLFTVINIFGFIIGVLGGHLLLNVCLFASPEFTIKIVKNQWITLIGTIAFIVLAAIGLIEVIRLVLEIASLHV